MKRILLLFPLLVFAVSQAQTVVYVDIDATGSNDGTSWTNAYNSLHDALTNTTTAGAEIWIAEGTYTPVNASTPFLNQYGVNIYGGFDGTEIIRADRSTDPWLHPVYLSGDINGDDLNEIPSATSANKTDNATRILQIEPTTVGGTVLDHVNAEIIIDRINLVHSYGGSAFYSYPHPQTGYTQKKITILNCRFSRNYAASRPALDMRSLNNSGTSSNPTKNFYLLNSIMDENVSQVGYAFEYRNFSQFVEIYIANNLFIANKVTDAGYSGSVARFISNGGQGLTVRFSNNTLALNQEGTGVAASLASCIRLERTSGAVNGWWYNNIYYNNTGTNEFVGTATASTASIDLGSTNALDFAPVYTVPNSIFLSESPFEDISAGNFAPLPAYRQTGTANGSAYDTNELPFTDCFQNGRFYSSGTIIGLGAIQYANTAMFTGPGNIASLSLPAPAATIYVDASATGNNDGTSWTDAYTTIYDAVNSTSVSAGSKIFVKAGTYKPTTGAYTIADASVKLIGGFDGTETDENDRDFSLIHTTNATIISGDVNDDDIYDDQFTNRTDNLAQLVYVGASFVTLDGFIIQNGHSGSKNPAIDFQSNTTNNFTLKNTIIQEHYSSGLVMDYRNFNGTVNFINVSVKNNATNGTTGILLMQSSNANNITANFVNFEFVGNQCASDFGAIWFRRTGTSTINSTIVNSTFADNVNFFSSTTLKQLINISATGSLNNIVNVHNSIFYNNLYNTSSVSDIVFDNSKTSEGNFGDLNIDNCVMPSIYPYTANVDADGFNINVANPNLDANYKPTSASTAVIDQGTNSFYDANLFGNADLSGNARFANTTVDLGAYEFNSVPLSVDDIEATSAEIIAYPNPTSSSVSIKTNETVTTIEVLNTMGQVVVRSQHTNQVDMANLPAGLYILNIATTKGNSSIKILKK